jgi:hypothetical protein
VQKIKRKTQQKIPMFSAVLLVTGTVHMKHVAGPNHFKRIWIQQFEKFGSGFYDREWRIPF